MSDQADDKLPHWLGPARLAIGFAQGLALFGLHRAELREYWPASEPSLFGALALVAAFAPLILIGGLNAIRPITLAAWSSAASALLALLGWHALARATNQQDQVWPVDAYLPAAALVYIVHHLVAAGDEIRRWIAPYERYFDLGWRNGAQLALSVVFVCVFWALLYLGATLFTIIGIDDVRELIAKDWFYYPAIATALAAGVHLTDLRASLVRGFRALSLTLLAWLGPVMTGLAGAFLAALPFTGLDPLWGTRSAGSILLSAAAALIVLINATYQDGGAAAAQSRMLRWSSQAAALLLVPLVALAAWALYLRVAQHGLSPERIMAGVLLAIGACYAAFYAAAAFSRPWLKLLERGNLVTALLVVGLLIAFHTPIADPARLSVADQLSRLQRGLVNAENFDFVFLRFEAGRYGREALARLQGDKSTPEAARIAARAEAIAAYDNKWEARNDQNPAVAEAEDEPRGEEAPAMRFEVYPRGQALPESFLAQAREGLVRGLGNCRRGRLSCEATEIDVNGDGAEEVLVAFQHQITIFERDDADRWRHLGRAQIPCRSLRSGLRRGDIVAVAPELHDLIIDGQRLRIETNGPDCGG